MSAAATAAMTSAIGALHASGRQIDAYTLVVDTLVCVGACVAIGVVILIWCNRS